MDNSNRHEDQRHDHDQEATLRNYHQEQEPTMQESIREDELQSHPQADVRKLGEEHSTVRRRFLQIAAGSVALGIAGCSGNSGGGGSDKTPKSKVNYQDHPKSGEQCSSCQYFIASGDGENAGNCQKVKGKIANDGWCSLFIEG